MFQAYIGLARVFMRQRKLDAARAEFEQLAARHPTSVVAPTMIGVILEMQNKRDEAEKMYERALSIDPTAPLPANNLASIYADRGVNLNTALELAQIAKQKMGTVGEVNDTLGCIFLKMNLVNRALAAFLDATRVNPNNPLFQYHLGLAYLRTKQSDKAKQAFDVALERQPNFPEAAKARAAIF